MRTFIAFLFLGLTGCYSPQKHAEGLQRIHGPYCESMGYRPQTDAWRNCIQAREDRNNAAVGTTCTRIGIQTVCN